MKFPTATLRHTIQRPLAVSLATPPRETPSSEPLTDTRVTAAKMVDARSSRPGLLRPLLRQRRLDRHRQLRALHRASRTSTSRHSTPSGSSTKSSAPRRPQAVVLRFTMDPPDSAPRHPLMLLPIERLKVRPGLSLSLLCQLRRQKDSSTLPSHVQMEQAPAF